MALNKRPFYLCKLILVRPKTWNILEWLDSFEGLLSMTFDCYLSYEFEMINYLCFSEKNTNTLLEKLDVMFVKCPY